MHMHYLMSWKEMFCLNKKGKEKEKGKKWNERKWTYQCFNYLMNVMAIWLIGPQ